MINNNFCDHVIAEQQVSDRTLKIATITAISNIPPMTAKTILTTL
ncbi:MAG: hypothetical protein AB4372_37835 [Xenococcus sp. (in: cyanobacteria)]